LTEWRKTQVGNTDRKLIVHTDKACLGMCKVSDAVWSNQKVMSVLSVFITSQNLIVHIAHSSADRVSSETIGFMPKYSFTICRDYSESFDQISSKRMIRLTARCQSVHRNSLKSQGAAVCLTSVYAFNFDCFTLFTCLTCLSVFLWSQSRTLLKVRGVNVFFDDFLNAGKKGI
jgi:hypothetical protein